MLLFVSFREQKFVSERTDASSGAVASAGTNGRTPHAQEDVSLIVPLFFCVLVSFTCFIEGKNIKSDELFQAL